MTITRILVLLLAVATQVLSQQVSPRYTLSMPEPWTHLFHVEVTFEGLHASETSLDLIMPVWRTGRYVLFDFAGSVQEFSSDNGKGVSLEWKKTDKSTWRIDTKGGDAVRVTYNVYADEFDMRTKGLNDQYAFVDGIAVFMYAEKYRRRPLTLEVVPYGSWHVTTGLDAVKGDPLRFTARDYDRLADCPMFIGHQKDHPFTAGGKPHVLSVLGEGKYDPEKLIGDVTAIVEAAKEFWGDLPYERYVFMLHLWSEGGGGTEHINSTIIQMRTFSFSSSRGREGFRGVVSHEFFHTWNVKRIRPSGISPYDYTRENYAREYWIAEGTTSYYTPAILRRAGLRSSGRALGMLGRVIKSERERPGNRIQSLSESSFDAWIKFWRDHPQSYNAETSYYEKGSIVSLMLDLTIRHNSKNQYSLDDVMRALYKRFPWDGTGYTVENFQKICEEYCGISLDAFFNDYVNGTAPLPWETVLGYAGLEVQAQKSEPSPWLGVMTRDRNGKSVVTGVIAGSPAYDGGLNADDELLALNGIRVRSSDLSQRISEMSVGDTAQIVVFRHDGLRTFAIPLGPQPVPNYTVTPVNEPNDLQKEIYKEWLGEELNTGE